MLGVVALNARQVRFLCEPNAVGLWGRKERRRALGYAALAWAHGPSAQGERPWELLGRGGSAGRVLGAEKMASCC